MDTKEQALAAFDQGQFYLIAGPCVIENNETPVIIAKHLKELSLKYNLPIVFKASYRKANRSSLKSFTGIGDHLALSIIRDISETLDMLVTTDIHSAEEANFAAQYVDIIQIPAFLCRQTELLLAAANTGRIINVKKGQFMSAESMAFAAEKIRSVNPRIMITERGTSFGYQDLIVDFRSVVTMQAFCKHVVVDCTHALQKPNQSSGVTGGDPEMISTIAKAATAVGANGLFIETHPNPAEAKSDGANMLPMDKLEVLIQQILKIREAIL